MKLSFGGIPDVCAAADESWIGALDDQAMGARVLPSSGYVFPFCLNEMYPFSLTNSTNDVSSESI